MRRPGVRMAAAIRAAKRSKVGQVKLEQRAKSRRWASAGRITAGHPWSVSWERV
jgi:hypothetical protein